MSQYSIISIFSYLNIDATGAYIPINKSIEKKCVSQYSYRRGKLSAEWCSGSLYDRVILIDK